jgi:hypothetical protein
MRTTRHQCWLYGRIKGDNLSVRCCHLALVLQPCVRCFFGGSVNEYMPVVAVKLLNLGGAVREPARGPGQIRILSSKHSWRHGRVMEESWKPAKYINFSYCNLATKNDYMSKGRQRGFK